MWNGGFFLSHIIFFTLSQQTRWDFPMSHGAVNLLAPLHPPVHGISKNRSSVFLPAKEFTVRADCFLSYSCRALTATPDMSVILLHVLAYWIWRRKQEASSETLCDVGPRGVSRILTHTLTLCEDRLTPFIITIQSFTSFHGPTHSSTN